MFLCAIELVQYGETFGCEFDARPARTRRYDTHFQEHPQMDLGLAAPLVIGAAAPEPLAYDREVTLVLEHSRRSPGVAAGGTGATPPQSGQPTSVAIRSDSQQSLQPPGGEPDDHLVADRDGGNGQPPQDTRQQSARGGACDNSVNTAAVDPEWPPGD
jgi:hypothetical protein